MSIEGLASIDRRIASIQTSIGALSAGVPAAASLSAQATASSGAVSGATGFEDVLARAVERTPGAAAVSSASPSAATALSGATVLGSAAVTASDALAGARDASGVPLELKGYGNGQVPAVALSAVGETGHRLWGPAARSLERLMADASAAGVTIGINDSYRSLAGQVDVAERLGLYSEGGLAAVPGTSQHGWGLAVDLRLDDGALAWMRANASRYGFIEDTPREPWHWYFSG